MPRSVSTAWLAPAFLLGSAALGLLGPLANFVSDYRLQITPPPIQVNDPRSEWVGPRILEISNPGSVWNRTCPHIRIDRLVQRGDGSFVSVDIDYLEGPLWGVSRDRFYEVSTIPGKRGPTRLRAHIPEWLDPRDVKLYVTNGTVAQNEPCEDGWAGTWRVYSSVVQPWPFTEADLRPDRQHD